MALALGAMRASPAFIQKEIAMNSLIAGFAIATFTGGADAIHLQNQHGVAIKLSGTEIGLHFNLTASGVNIALKS
jgi:hypothetical protein